MSKFIALMFAALSATAAVAADFPQGSIMLLPTCPGDQVKQAADQPQESAATAVLTPLVTGAIGRGLKALGAKLQELAAEQQIDALSTGDHFFVTADKDPSVLGLKSFCVVAATKSVMSTPRTLADLVSGYSAAEYLDTNGARRITSWLNSGATALADRLEQVGYANGSKPGVVVVFDVDVSVQRSHVRLVPRFVVMDHSVREKRADSKPRDITFEVAFTAASAEEAFGREVFKFDGLTPNAARRRLTLDIANPSDGGPSALLLPGQWFGLPSLGEASQSRLTKLEAAIVKINSETQTAVLARAAAVKLGATMEADCPTMDASLESWASVNAALVAEQAKPQSAQNAVVVATSTHQITFYSACIRMRDAENVRDALVLKDLEAFVAFDLAMNVKEFRERPAAKFFGDLLSDDTVRGGVTTALVNAVDPGTREAADEKREAEIVAARVKLEQALLEAEKAALEYAAADAATKEAKRLDLEFKRRAVNRAADELNLPRPYPADGVWYSG